MRKILLGIGVLVGLIVVALGGVVAYSVHKHDKTYELPLPNITRATSPEAIARGKHIFQTVCASCHEDDTGSYAGRQTNDLPTAFGFMYTANLTSHPEAGVGSWTDQELARMIIHAIDRNGKVRPMLGFKYMSDDDVAAIIGFMRSDDPGFAPVAKVAPESQPAVPFKIITAMILGINAEPRQPVTAPAEGATPEYGKYAATALYDCYFCHTEGFSGNKLNEPNLFAGNFEFDLSTMGVDGKLYSPNITPHPTAGIGAWTLDEFKRALREGVSRDNSILRPPMVKYRYLHDVEMEAIYKYLKTVPASDRVPKVSTVPRAKAEAAEGPDKLFSSLGCELCHGANKQFTQKLKNAVGKSPEQVAQWIRSPESFKPGTQMPSYAALLNEDQAVVLAKWVLDNKAKP